MSKSDREASLSRARNAYRVVATDQVVDEGEEVVLAAVRVIGTTAGSVELRSGGAAGDLLWELSVPAGEDARQDFPVGLHFPDGLHVTLGAGDEVVYIAAT